MGLSSTNTVNCSYEGALLGARETEARSTRGIAGVEQDEGFRLESSQGRPKKHGSCLRQENLDAIFSRLRSRNDGNWAFKAAIREGFS